MRKPNERDFEVKHPELGRFVYGRRTYGDRIAIRRRYLDLLGRDDDKGVDDDLAAMAAIVAMHDVLCVSAPAGWQDLAQVDLLEEPRNEALLIELYALVKQKEGSFRRFPAQEGPGGGEGDVPDVRVLVPPALPAVGQ